MDPTPLRTAKASFSGLMADLSGEELMAASREVARTTETPGWGILHDLVERKVAQLVAQLVHGPVQEQHSYVAVTSMASGMEQVANLPRVVDELAARAARELSELVEGAV